MQSVNPLFIDDDFAKAQGGQLDYSELEEFMLTTGLTKDQLWGDAPMPEADYDVFWTYQYGRSLVAKKDWPSLGTQMYLLNKWYMKACDREEQFLFVRVSPEHYFLGYDIIHQLLHRNALDKSLVSCWCL
jgi:hypothetical protein